MELGAVTITNLDEYSPCGFQHMENVVDITKCSNLPTDEAALAAISRRAIETSRARSWSSLVSAIGRQATARS
jgi:hypothetical protein